MNIKLTKKAEEELLKLVAGEISKINFTEMAVGDGLYTADETLADITALKSVRIKTKVGNIYEELVGGSNKLFITSTFYNKDIEAKFEVREVGIFAKSTDTDAEYLYAYYIVKSDDMAIAIIQDKTTPQYIPISVNSKLSSIDEANITLLDDMLVVNQVEFQRYKIDAKEYADIGDSSTFESAKEYTDEKTNVIDNSLSKHISNKSNPHSVTKAQLGLGNVDNTADSSKSVNYANSSNYSNSSGVSNGNPKFPNYTSNIPYSGGHTNHYAPADGWIWFELHGNGSCGLINNVQVTLQTTNNAIFTPPMPIRAGWSFRGTNTAHFHYNA